MAVATRQAERAGHLLAARAVAAALVRLRQQTRLRVAAAAETAADMSRAATAEAELFM